MLIFNSDVQFPDDDHLNSGNISVFIRELSYLSEGEVNYSNNYIGVNRVSCCKGQYPKALLTEWDRYDDRKGSENDRPGMYFV